MIIDITVTLLTATATATAVNDIAVTVVLNDEIINPEETFCERVDDCLDIPSANGNYVLKILNGVKSWVSESTGGGVWGSIIGTITNQTDLVNYITTRLTGYATEAFVTTQGYITNVVTALGYTPENVANKSDSYTLSSSTTYASTKALVDGLATKGSGTVTSVSALTLGTNGTDLSSTVSNGTTTPVITLNVPTASATNRGALSSTDWSTFNSKQDYLTAANFGSFINGLIGKTSPVDADSLTISDSADSNNAKKLSWANLKATLKTYFDTLYTSVQKAYLSSGDATLTSSTTPTNITGLSFSLEANSRYEISGQLFIGSGNSSGGQWGATIPTGASMKITAFGMQASGSAFKREVINTSGVLVGNYPAAFTAAGFLWLSGTIETGANAGNFQVQWACTAGGYTITCYKLGTALTLIKL